MAGDLGFARAVEDWTVRNWGCLGLLQAGRSAVRSGNGSGGQDPQALWGLPGSSLWLLSWPQLNVPIPGGIRFPRRTVRTGWW